MSSTISKIVWRDGADPEVYEEARIGRLFNDLAPKRYPLAIVFVKTESEIMDAVKLAIEKQCRISLRAGGHSFAAWGLQDDAILVDLGDYSELVLDENTGVVRVSPSMTGKDLYSYLSGKGRIFPVGHCPDVGIGGYLLGGGMGWNCNNWGWACEHIVAVDVVTSNGQLVEADAQNHSDLFWAARGAGPAFPGIITRFHLQTRPAPRLMRSSGYVYPMRHYRTAFNWVSKVPSGSDDAIEIAAVGNYPQGMDEPCITIALVAFGDQEETIKEALQHIEESHPEGTVAHWFCEETSIPQEFENKAKAYPDGHRYCVDNAFLKNDVDVTAILEPAFTTLPTKKSLALWTSMVPCSRRELPDMALSMQSDHYFALFCIWEDESDDSRCQSWVHDIMVEVGRQSFGAYVGEFDFQARQCKLWGDKERKRIMDIRREWDPQCRICGCLGLDDISGLEGIDNYV